jgi:hypothetical protein
MAKPRKEKWSTGTVATVVAAALALFVGVFIFYSNKYSGADQVTQINIPLAPGNELPIAPITPPASPPIATPSDNQPVNQ